MTKQELLQSLASHGVANNIIQAFRVVNREDFIPPEYQPYAYEDGALPIGQGQTISQPYTIAFMLNLLQVNDQQKILEVGAGSGYVLALLNQLSQDAKIFATERILDLVERSQQTLADYKNIKIFHTPDNLGLAKEQPFDRILVSAAAEQLPEELIAQLSDDGILVCPVKDSIIKVWQENNQIKKEEHYGFAFVPLIIKTKTA